MPTWTPPVIIGRSQHDADQDLFARLGLDTDDSDRALPADASTSKPLSVSSQRLAQAQTSTRVSNKKQDSNHWTLTRDQTVDARLILVRPDKVHLCVDFKAGKTRHRTTESGKGAQALSKALGIKKFVRTNHEYPLIIDATGGLGQDAWALASIGCSVTIIERHPVVYALLQDGLSRALRFAELPDSTDTEHTRIANRISLVLGDATQCLSQLCEQHQPHAIYLDPMYPERRKKASSKKGMQILHALLGPPVTDESSELLHCAIKCRASRVAVKRPAGAPLLPGSDGVNSQRTAISTPNTRYDIYHQ